MKELITSQTAVLSRLMERPARLISAAVPVFVFCLCAVLAASAGSAATLKVRNTIDLPRSNETISLQAEELRQLLKVDDLRRIHVRDQQSGQELLTQAVDENDDGVYDELIFQADVGALQTKLFLLTAGEIQLPRREDFNAYGRFVRERMDDFAWENDRIAHRMYGAALETWAREPLTSSAVDVWVKNVPRLVINDWYMVDDYHRDHGEGGDFYSAGSTRGCGGNGIWADGKLYPSANFRKSRVIANGPIRVMFELIYDSWDAHGVRISELKRITLDAGQNFSRFESRYRVAAGSPGLTSAIGIRKGANAAAVASQENGTMRSWESLGDNGQLGCAIVAAPADWLGSAQDDANYFVKVKVGPQNVASYYAGFGWSKSPQFHTLADWDRYVAEFARRLRAPLELKLKAE